MELSSLAESPAGEKGRFLVKSVKSGSVPKLVSMWCQSENSQAENLHGAWENKQKQFIVPQQSYKTNGIEIEDLIPDLQEFYKVEIITQMGKLFVLNGMQMHWGMDIYIFKRNLK